MPLTATNFVNKGPVLHADLLQFYNLFTGVMVDQPVTFKNTVTVGGNQGTTTVPVKLYGAVGQTSHLLDLYTDNTNANPGWGIGASGAMAWGPGGAAPTDTTLSRVATQHGHSTDTAGLLVTPYLEVAGGIGFNGALNFLTSGASIAQGGAGTLLLTVNQDLYVNRAVLVGSGGFSVPPSAAGIQVGATPTYTTYGILISPTLTAGGVAGLTLSPTAQSTVTSFMEVIQISGSTQAATFTMGSWTGIAIRQPTKGAGNTIQVMQGINITDINGGIGATQQVIGIIVQGISGANACGIQINSGTATGLLNFSATQLARTSISGGATVGVNTNFSLLVTGQTQGSGTFQIYSQDSAGGVTFSVRDDGYVAFHSNTSYFDTSNDLHVGHNLYVHFNTIYLFSDGTRFFNANGPSIAYVNASGGTHLFYTSTLGTYGPCAASAFNVNSSRKVKTNIVPLSDALDILLDERIHGVRYTEIATGKPRVGFVADDFLEVLPSVVMLDDVGDVVALDYDRLSAVTFEALKTHVINTEARIAALEARLAA